MSDQEQARPEAVDSWAVAEFFCWCVVVLAPLLTWINGPAVSTDQYLVRWCVFVLALLSATGMRARRILDRRRAAAAE
jgi:hypothetical protein